MTTSVIAIAKTLNICATLLHSICYTESHGRNVVNHFDGGTPSYGVCQVKLATARLFNKDVTAKDLMNPNLNIWYAALYLKKHQEKHADMACVIASYNAGQCFKKNGVITNATYVEKVKKVFNLERKGILYNQTNCPKII